MMWKLKLDKDGLEYQDRKRKTEEVRDERLKHVREYAEGDLRRLFLEYHEEVPGEESNEPTYPLRGGAEWR